MAQAKRFSIRFNNAVFDTKNPDQSFRKYQDTFENLKTFIKQNENHSYLKYHIDEWRMIQTQCAELLEGRLDGKILVKPVLEFYRRLYEKYDDAHDAEGWIGYIDRELEKYTILTADDPFAAFQAKVEELKQSLETDLSEESRQKSVNISSNRRKTGVLKRCPASAFDNRSTDFCRFRR